MQIGICFKHKEEKFCIYKICDSNKNNDDNIIYCKNIKNNEVKKLRINKDTKLNFIGYQYKIIYFNKDKQSKIIGDFYAKYNYQIKFEAYRYLKKILQQNKIYFGIYNVSIKSEPTMTETNSCFGTIL